MTAQDTQVQYDGESICFHLRYIQDKNGKWGLFQLSGQKSKFKEILACNYDRFESFAYRKKKKAYMLFFRVLWLKTNTLNKPGGNRYVSHRFVEERTEFADHTRWLQTSP